MVLLSVCLKFFVVCAILSWLLLWVNLFVSCFFYLFYCFVSVFLLLFVSIYVRIFFSMSSFILYWVWIIIWILLVVYFNLMNWLVIFGFFVLQLLRMVCVRITHDFKFVLGFSNAIWYKQLHFCFFVSLLYFFVFTK